MVDSGFAGAACMRSTTTYALALRVGIALFTRTFFQPDEYFQSLEPAHHIVFGYGKLTWEWLAAAPIRSALYPSLNVPLFWLLKVLGLDGTSLLIWAPKVLHGSLAALTDVYVGEIARKVIGARYVSMTYFLSVTSLFHLLALSRSLSNSLETSAATVALSFYSWDLQTLNRQDIRKCLFFAAIACAVRPTNAILWVFLFGWKLRSRISALQAVVVDALLIGSVMSATIMTTDSLYYGKPIFTPLNFLLTNLSSVSLFYGSSPWHYYLSQGLPILCTTALPSALHGLWQLWRTGDSRSSAMVGVVLWTLGIYSLTGHKEWRFLHPLLPLLHICAAKSLVDIFVTPRCLPDGEDVTNHPDQKGSKTVSPLVSLPKPLAAIHLLLFVFPGIYLALFHGRAQIALVHHIRALPHPDALHSLGFLMPCHSTPWQAYIHRPDLADPGRMWAIGCEPPLAGQNLSTYKDQSDVFYDAPLGYLRERFPERVDPSFPPSPYPCTIPGTPPSSSEWRHEWPQYLAMFGALLHIEGIQDLLEERGYHEVWATWNGFEEDERRRDGTRLWKYIA